LYLQKHPISHGELVITSLFISLILHNLPGTRQMLLQ
jgi:hypothetical protein